MVPVKLRAKTHGEGKPHQSGQLCVASQCRRHGAPHITRPDTPSVPACYHPASHLLQHPACTAQPRPATQQPLPPTHSLLATLRPAISTKRNTRFPPLTSRPTLAAHPRTHSLLATLRSVISTPAKGSVALLSGMTPEKLFPARWTMCRLG